MQIPSIYLELNSQSLHWAALQDAIMAKAESNKRSKASILVEQFLHIRIAMLMFIACLNKNMTAKDLLLLQLSRTFNNAHASVFKKLTSSHSVLTLEWNLRVCFTSYSFTK